MIKFEPDTSDFPEHPDDIASARGGCKDYCGVSEALECGNKSELQTPNRPGVGYDCHLLTETST